MRLFIVILLLAGSLIAKAETPCTYNLEGTVGNQKIVMFIVSGKDKTWGRYFFKDNPISNIFSGRTTSNGFELWVTAYQPLTDKPVNRITIMLQADSADHWHGTWDPSDPEGYPLDRLHVSLQPTDFAHIKNPWENYPIMHSWLRLDSFDRYRIACVRINNDSVVSKWGCGLQRRYIRGTDLSSWFIVSGINHHVKATIDTYLTKELLQTYYSPLSSEGTGRMSTTGIYLSKQVYSLRRETYSSNSFREPSTTYNSITFDLKTGAVLKLEQVLQMKDVHESYVTSDGMEPPCCKETGAVLYNLFNNLYPSQMAKYYQQCHKQNSTEAAWFHFFWFISEKGVYIGPQPWRLHDCDPPDFSYIPFDTVWRYSGKVRLR